MTNTKAALKRQRHRSGTTKPGELTERKRRLTVSSVSPTISSGSGEPSHHTVPPWHCCFILTFPRQLLCKTVTSKVPTAQTVFTEVDCPVFFSKTHICWDFSCLIFKYENNKVTLCVTCLSLKSCVRAAPDSKRPKEAQSSRRPENSSGCKLQLAIGRLRSFHSNSSLTFIGTFYFTTLSEPP